MNRMAQLADAVLLSLGVHEIPVPVEPLLKMNRVITMFWSFPPPIVGLSRRGKYRNFITLNRSLSYEQQRRLIVHECAHIMYHVGNHFFMAKDPSQRIIMDKQEHQAEAFAAFYLMPEREVDTRSCLDIAELVDYFVVPEDLVRFRLYLKTLCA